MKKMAYILFRLVVILVSIGMFIILIRFPQLEGRAAHLNLLQIYLDPLILFMYIGSIPFFYGMYEFYILLSIIEHNRVRSKNTVIILKRITFSSLILSGYIVFAVIYIRLIVKGDDPAGPTMLGSLIVLICISIAISALWFERKIQESITTPLKTKKTSIYC